MFFESYKFTCTNEIIIYGFTMINRSPELSRIITPSNWKWNAFKVGNAITLLEWCSNNNHAHLFGVHAENVLDVGMLE